MIKSLLFIILLSCSQPVLAQQLWYRQLSVGGNALDASSILDINSTTKGARPCPSMDETERDNIASPVSGLCVYNTDTNVLNYFDGSVWGALGGGGGDLWSDPLDSDILPDTPRIRDLGAIANPMDLVFSDGYFLTDSVNLSNSSYQTANNGLSVNGVRIRTDNDKVPLTLETITDNDADTDDTQTIYILTGDKPNAGSTGDTGDVHMETGFSFGGVRGSLLYIDGTEGTAGDVLTSTDTSGTVGWATPAGGGGGSTENVNLDIKGGGIWDFDGTNLTNSEDAFIQFADFLDDRNTILAQSINMSSNDTVAFVDVNKVTDSTTNLTVSTVAIGSYTAADDRYIIARRNDDAVNLAEQQGFATTANMIVFAAPTSWRAQSFLTTSAGNLTEVKLKLFRDVSLTGPFKIVIQNDSAGDPSGSDLESLTVTAGAVAALPTSAGGVFQTFTFAGTTALLNGTTYWLVFDPDFTAGGALKVEYDAGGSYVGEFKSSANSGSTWGGDLGLDIAFEIIATAENVEVGHKLKLVSGDSARIYEGITAAQLQVIPDSANPTLSNLDSPTAINQILIPGSGQGLGTDSTPFGDSHFTILTIGKNSGVVKVNWKNAGNTIKAKTEVDGTTPNGTSAALVTYADGDNQDLAFATDKTTSPSSPTGKLIYETGDIDNAGSSADTGDQDFSTGSTNGSGDSGDFNFTNGTSASGALGKFIMTTNLLDVSAGIKPVSLTADPCGDTVAFPESTQFYNDTSNYYCFCDGTNDVQMHDPSTACF